MLDETKIDAVLLKQKAPLMQDFGRIIERQAYAFVGDLFSTFRKQGLALKAGTVMFVVVCSILLQQHIQAFGKIGSALFVRDIRANA